MQWMRTQSKDNQQQQRLRKESWKGCAPGGHTSSGARSQSRASRCSTVQSTQDVSIELHISVYRHSSRSEVQCQV